MVLGIKQPHVSALMRNRGAMVSKPSVREAREVFAARRLIETSIVESVIKSATRRDIKRLQEHVAREQDAWGANDRRAILKLSGEFHLLLAEAAVPGSDIGAGWVDLTAADHGYARGGTFNKVPARDVGGGRLVATVTDPDGNIIRIQSAH